MSKFHDDPLKPEGRLSPSEKRRRERAADERARHMVYRFLAAEAAAKAGKRAKDRVRAVEMLFIEGHLGDWMPTRPTICALGDAYASGQTNPEAYFVAGAGGRPKAVLPQLWHDWLETEVEEHGVLDVSLLIRRLRLVAPADELPGDDALRRIVYEIRGGVLERSSKLHGRRAGEVDGVPHETLPYEYPLDCLTEDELVLPVWVGLWSDQLDRFLSTLLYVAFVLDYVSRAIVAYHLCDPTRRRGPEGQQLFTGVDASDITAVFLKATRPELAPECTLPYTGYEPAHIRLDGASVHRKWYEEIGSRLATRVHVLASYRPYRNGVHERMGFTAKRAFRALFLDVAGNVEEYLPTDRIRQNQHQARVEAAATDRRVRRRIPIDPKDLPWPGEIERIVLPKITNLYNKVLVHSALGMTPYNAFMSKRPRPHHLRPSGPMVRALPAATATVNGTSIVLQRDGVREKFSAKVDGRTLPVGSTHIVHVHPLLAGVWLEDGPRRELKFLPTLAAAARQQSGRVVAKARSEMTGGLSEQAQRIADRRAEEARGLLPANTPEDAPAPEPSSASDDVGAGTGQPAEKGTKKRANRAKQADDGSGQLNPDLVAPRSPVPDADPSSDVPDLCEEIVAGTTTPQSAEDIWLARTPLADDRSGATSDAATTAAPDAKAPAAKRGSGDQAPAETPSQPPEGSRTPAETLPRAATGTAPNGSGVVPRAARQAPASLWLTRVEITPSPRPKPSPNAPPTPPVAPPGTPPAEPGSNAA